MGSRIDNLIKKYWDGKTSLAEEKEIRNYFNDQPHLTADGIYFRKLDEKNKENAFRSFTHPGKRIRQRWMSVAATVVLGITVAFFAIRDAGQQNDYVVKDPKEAYEVTKKALIMVSSGLNEGAEYSTEIKKINKAEEILKQEEK